MQRTTKVGIAVFGPVIALTLHTLVSAEYLNGIQWKVPPVVTPGEGTAAPSDATVLFDGKDFSAWDNADKWTIKDGAAVAGKGNITTKAAFGDCQLHIECSSPLPVKGTGQARGRAEEIVASF